MLSWSYLYHHFSHDHIKKTNNRYYLEHWTYKRKQNLRKQETLLLTSAGLISAKSLGTLFQFLFIRSANNSNSSTCDGLIMQLPNWSEFFFTVGTKIYIQSAILSHYVVRILEKALTCKIFCFRSLCGERQGISQMR